MNKSTLKAIAKLTHIDLMTALKTKRHNPLLDSEITIEEELINLKESMDSYYTAGDTLYDYPKIQAHMAREKRDIMSHCIGLVVRMLHGKVAPRPYGRQDVDYALRRLVQLVVEESRRAGKRLDADMLGLFRPYLTVRQRVALRDFSADMVLQASQLPRVARMAAKLPLHMPKNS